MFKLTNTGISVAMHHGSLSLDSRRELSSSRDGCQRIYFWQAANGSSTLTMTIKKFTEMGIFPSFGLDEAVVATPLYCGETVID